MASPSAIHQLPAEVALVAACCRWPPSQERTAAIRAAASHPIDWDRFERVVARHRVFALVRDGLRAAAITIAPATEQRLAAAVAAAAHPGLAMARETLSLQDSFDREGLPVLFLKGVPVAILAYGSLSMKQSWDIDLLTTPDSAAAGRRLLLQLGYEMILPAGLDEATFLRFSEFSKEAVFFNAALGIYVELHWRLTDNVYLLPALDARSASQIVPLAGGGMRTLRDEALFAYLCAHGGSHGWARLKWLADVNAFLSGRSGVEIERLYRASVAAGAGRTPAVALLLCQELLGLALPRHLAQEMRSDRRATSLVSNSLACITYGRGEKEFSCYSAAGLRIQLSHFFLAPERRYFWYEMKYKWMSSDDAITVNLPRRLTFCYPLLRLPLWLLRVGRRLVARPSH